MIQSDATRPSLLVRIRDSRDRQAWDQFVEIYAPLVYQTARRRGLQDADACDLTQDVLRSVAQAIGRLEYDRRKGTFRGWLFTVTRNKLNSFVETQRREPRGTGGGQAESLLEAQANPTDESEVWNREYRQRLLAVAAEQVRPSFEETTWQAFWQTAVEDQPAKRVAARLRISVGALYIARSRVLSRLKSQVQALLDE
jgi:RNA polymerase sigma-70 factor (ECF subfamily)